MPKKIKNNLLKLLPKNDVEYLKKKIELTESMIKTTRPEIGSLFTGQLERQRKQLKKMIKK